MSQIILHILCEGQTEERFVNDVFKEYIKSFNIVVKPQLLVTSKKRNCRGGLLNYAQAKRDLELMIKQNKDTEYEKHWFTTMFDYYALPNEFPGFENNAPNPYQRVECLEQKFLNDISNERFIPYIQLHEFESLVFAGLDYLREEYPKGKTLDKRFDGLKEALSSNHDNPELVNNNFDTAPSKRIIAALKGIHSYNKPKIGASVTKKIGICALKTRCVHFASWINKLETLCQI